MILVSSFEIQTQGCIVDSPVHLCCDHIHIGVLHHATCTEMHGGYIYTCRRHTHLLWKYFSTVKMVCMICIWRINDQLISSGLWRIVALASSLSVRNFGVAVELDLTFDSHTKVSWSTIFHLTLQRSGQTKSE